MNYQLIKVCGMRHADNIRQVEALGPDWMGLIFWPRSSRCVDRCPDYLPTRARRVGVFVDQPADEIVRIARDYRLDAIQLHGHETPADLCRLRTALDAARGARPDGQAADTTAAAGTAPALIKAFSISTAADLERTADYDGAADYLLFDTKTPLAGGSGRQFDWRVLDAYHGTTPFLLSGGIGPDDTGRLAAFHHPRCIGIDLNSRFELEPGLKDIGKLKTFIKKIREL